VLTAIGQDHCRAIFAVALAIEIPMRPASLVVDLNQWGTGCLHNLTKDLFNL
jgi:hypothetical protein